MTGTAAVALARRAGSLAPARTLASKCRDDGCQDPDAETSDEQYGQVNRDFSSHGNYLLGDYQLSCESIVLPSGSPAFAGRMWKRPHAEGVCMSCPGGDYRPPPPASQCADEGTARRRARDACETAHGRFCGRKNLHNNRSLQEGDYGMKLFIIMMAIVCLASAAVSPTYGQSCPA